jgi:hypothetical protein
MADHRFTKAVAKSWKPALLLAIGLWIYNYSGVVDFGIVSYRRLAGRDRFTLLSKR